MCRNNPLTLLIIAKDKGILNDLLCPQYLNESSDLTVLLPFCGKGNIKRIKMWRDCKVISSDFEQILALSAVPIHFKRQRPELVLEQVETVMNRIRKSNTISQEYSECLCISLEIIFELLFKCKHEHEINRSGECCKVFTKTHNYNTTPFLVRCIKCDTSFCVACARNHAKYDGNQLRFLTYTLNSKATCNCSIKHEAAFISAVLCELKESKTLNMFATSGIKVNEHEFNTSKDSSEISITSTNKITIFNDDSRPITLFYYEVYIKRAGITENIIIGFDGTGVEYSGWTGEILKNSEVIGNGPRFGSKDIIGIGLTSSYFIYFTFNGFNLHIYVECEPIREIRPLVRLHGKNIRVKLKFDKFMSDSKSYPTVPQIRINQLIKDIEDWIKYYAEKSKIFPFMKSNAESIKRVASNLSSQLPLNFPYFDAHNVPIRASSKSFCNIF